MILGLFRGRDRNLAIVDGLDAFPDALNMLFEGRNFGKQLVRVGPDKA